MQKREQLRLSSHMSRRTWLGAALASSAVPSGLIAARLGAQGEANRSHRRRVVFEHVEKIYSDGRWNGRPTIVFWRGRYHIFFREGSEHSSQDGRIAVLRSEGQEPRGWTRHEVADGRENEAEAHVLVTPDRLFVYLVLEDPTRGGGQPIASQVIYTDDGDTWSRPTPVYEPEFSFWKPATHDGVHYVASDVMVGKRRVELLKSIDGVAWSRVSTILSGKFTETSLTFLEDESLLAVTRQAQLSLARPPYTKWNHYPGVGLGGPAAVRLGDTVLVSGRTSRRRFPDDQPGSSRTGLFALDRADMTLKWQTNLVTQWGGDVSYPDFHRLDDRRALIAWYDGEGYEEGVPKQSDLFLATLRIVV